MAVSIQQSASTTLATYLKTAFPDVDIQDRWPDPDCKFATPRITIIMIGTRRDTPIDKRILSFTPIHGPKASTATWQLKACEQLYQIDIWTTNDYARDDILARLDNVTNAGDGGDMVAQGLLLTGSADWPGTFFDYYFESADLHDAPYNTVVNEYRATLLCHSWFMLTVDHSTTLQTLIKFQATIRETDPVTVPNITLITP